MCVCVRVSQVIDFEAEKVRFAAEQDACEGGPSHSDWENGRQDCYALGSHLRRRAKRKGAPPWSAPAEVWLLCARPFDQTGPHKQTAGVGATFVSTGGGEGARGILERLMAHVRRVGRAPAYAHRSQGFALPKHNQKPGALAWRLLQNGCPFWKHMYGMWLDRSLRRRRLFWPSYMHGFLRGRRREDAMLSQFVMSERASKVGVPFVTVFHDMANAFPSMAQSALLKALPQVVAEPECTFFAQRIINSVCGAPLGDNETLEFIPGSGAPPGTAEAPILFAKAFQPVITEWNLELAHDTRPFRVRCAFSARVVDGSLNLFADDICRKLPIITGTAAEATTLLAKNQAELDNRIRAVQLQQNHSKVIVVPALRSGRQNRILAEAGHVNGQVVPTARYLGARLAWNNNLRVELQFRVEAAAKNWYAYRRVLVSQAPRRLRRLMFLVMVQSSLLSGLEAFPLRDRHCKILDTQLCRRLRSMLRGQATDWEGHNHPVTMSLRRLFSEWRVCPTRVELSARRIRWLQSMIRDREAHEHVIALIWGQAHCESKPTLDAEGLLTEQANSMAQQFAEDMRLLSNVGAAEEFVELWASCGSSWRALFESEEVRQSFLLVDVSELRSRYLAQCLQSDAAEAGGEVSVEELRGDWVCGLPDAMGRICDAAFRTRAACLVHRRCAAAGGGHGRWQGVHGAVITNQCPVCATVLASRRAATHHLIAALKSGRCRCDATLQSWDLVQPTSLDCPFCEWEAGHLALLQQHI